MDQDAFRGLLSKPEPSRSLGSGGARGSFLPPKSSLVQQKTSQALKPDFKPRQLKKKVEGRYRDRATERREGAAGDFAEVEAVLESFEKRYEGDYETIEQQRQYLGGDAEHTVLVKGLDFALLEQQKAKSAKEVAGVDDDALESAFLGVDSAKPVVSEPPSEQRKRTREDIIQDLKNKRSNVSGTEDSSKPSDAPLNSGKFKPLGFKPIGSTSKIATETKKKKKKVKSNAQKSSVGNDGQVGTESTTATSSEMKPGPSSLSTKTHSVSEPAPVDADFDIFAGVGDYEGVDFDDDAGLDAHRPALDDSDQQGGSSDSKPRKKWFEDEPELPSSTPEIPSLLRSTSKGKAAADDTIVPVDERADQDKDTPADDRNETEEHLIRLSPLASSAVPSIRDILAADSALEAEQTRKARKEKRKAGGGGGGGEKKKVSEEAKLNRDYQKLQSYQAKKSAS